MFTGNQETMFDMLEEAEVCKIISLLENCKNFHKPQNINALFHNKNMYIFREQES